MRVHSAGRQRFQPVDLLDRARIPPIAGIGLGPLPSGRISALRLRMEMKNYHRELLGNRIGHK